MSRENWNLNSVDPSIFELIDRPILIFTSRGDILFANTPSEKFFQIPVEKLEARILFEFLDKSSRFALEKCIQTESIIDFTPLDLSFKLDHKSASVDVSAQISIVHQDGNNIQYALILDDNSNGDKNSSILGLSNHHLEDRQLLHHIIELNPYAIVIFDPEGHFLHGNSAYYDLLIYEPSKDYKIFEDLRIFNPDLLEDAMGDFRKGLPLYIPQILYNVQNFNPKLPPFKKWLSVHLFSLYDSENFVRYPIIMFEDVTDRVKAKKTLDEYNEELENEIEKRTNTLRNVIQSNPYSIAIFDGDGRYIESNKAFKQLFGFTPLPNFKIEESQLFKVSQLEAEYGRLLQGNIVEIPIFNLNPRNYRSEYPDHDLSLKLVAFPIFSKNNELDRIIFMFENKTNERKAKAQLHFERDQMLSIFDSFPEIVYVHHPQTKEVLYSNTKLKSLSISMGSFDQIVNNFTDKIELLMNDYLMVPDMDQIPLRLEHYHPILQKYYLVTARFIKWNNDKRVILVFAIDISDRIKYEKQLEEKLKFKDIITEISSSFVQYFNIDQVIDSAFAKISSYLQCREISLFRQDYSELSLWSDQSIRKSPALGETSTKFSLTNFWSKIAYDASIKKGSTFNIRASSPFYKLLLKEDWITFRYSKDHPLYPLSFQRIFDNSKGLYSIFFPIRYRGVITGLILFSFEFQLINEEHISLLKIFTDILANVLEREWAESNLAREHNTLDNIIQSNPFGIAIFDGKGYFESGNRALEKLFKNFPPPSNYCLFHDKILVRTGYIEDLRKLNQGATVYIPPMLIRKEDNSFFENDQEHYIKLTAFPIISTESVLENIIVMVEDITTETLTSQNLVKSEIKYESLFRNSSIGIAIIDFQGKIHEINAKMVELIGSSIDEIKNFDVRKLYTNPKDEEIILEALRTQGKVENLELQVKDYYGNLYWAIFSLQQFEIQNESLLYITQIDITEKHLALQKLRKSEQNFQALVESSNDLIWELDNKGLFTYLSPKCEDLHGYPPEYFLGKDFSVLELEEGLFQKIKKDFGNVIRLLRDEPRKALRFNNYIVKCKHRDGSPLILEVNGSPIISANNEWLGYRGVSRDVTLRVNAEAKIKQSEEQYRNVVETSNDIIFISDKNGQYQFLNSANERVLGYKLADLYQMNGFELIHPDDLEDVHKRMSRLYEGELVTNIEYRFRAQSGKYIHLQTNGSPIYNNKGELNGFLGVARDVTELVKKERELRERELNLQYANVMTMVSSILIHDNPHTKLNINPILRTLGNSIRANYIFVLEKALDNYSSSSSPSSSSSSSSSLSVSYNIMEMWQKSSVNQLDISVLEPQIVEHFEFLDMQDLPKEIYRRIQSSDFSPDVKSLMEHLNFHDMVEVPIYLKDTLHGHLLLVSTQKNYEFQPHSIKLSLSVAMLIGFGLQRALSTEVSQLLFQTLNSLDISVFIVEILPSGNPKFNYMNDRFCEFYGYSREAIMMLRNYAMLIPESEQKNVEKIGLALNNSLNKSQIYPISLKTRTGVKDVLLSISYGTSNEKQIIFGLFIDDVNKTKGASDSNTDSDANIGS
ncbi:MAG: PAS domain S-box protein [Promethearchaeota archaeon]